MLSTPELGSWWRETTEVTQHQASQETVKKAQGTFIIATSFISKRMGRKLGQITKDNIVAQSSVFEL